MLMRSCPSFALVGRFCSSSLISQVVSHVVSGGVRVAFDPSECEWSFLAYLFKELSTMGGQGEVRVRFGFASCDVSCVLGIVYYFRGKGRFSRCLLFEPYQGFGNCCKFPGVIAVLLGSEETLICFIEYDRSKEAK